MAKIIICDDEPLIRNLIKDFFKKEGYEIIEAENGVEMLEKFTENPDTNLIILDVMMPEMDGWEACRNLRKTSNVPVIMLTARSEEFDHLMGFESGVDEYVTKPFSPAVLVKRAEAVIRRSQAPESILDSQKGLVVDTEAYTAFLDGKRIELTLKEFEILQKLFENKGRVFTRDQLLTSIWGYDYEGEERTVDSHIARLRTKMGEYGARLKTVYGLGYKLD